MFVGNEVSNKSDLSRARYSLSKNSNQMENDSHVREYSSGSYKKNFSSKIILL